MELMLNPPAAGMRRPLQGACSLVAEPDRGHRLRPQADGAALAMALDAVDYGVVVVDTELHVQHLNRAARHRLLDTAGLALVGQRLQLDQPQLAERLRLAVARAVTRAVRSTLTVHAQLQLAVVPCDSAGPAPLAVLVLSRAQVCSRLALEALAREHKLTPAETSVLNGLSRGATPDQIAQRHGVALCTVRTQLVSARTKLGVGSTREVLTLLANLPPLVALVSE